MPKGFDIEQKEEIKKALIEKAKKHFAFYGYNRTNIRDLVKGTGIALGTFYKFFTTKEELFMEVVKDEGERIYKYIFDDVLSKETNPQEKLKLYIKTLLCELDKNTIMQKILLQDEMEYVLGKLSRQQINEHKANSIVQIKTILDSEVSTDNRENINTEVAAGAVRSIFFLSFHKEQIGIQQYPEIMEYIINLICEDIFKKL